MTGGRALPPWSVLLVVAAACAAVSACREDADPVVDGGSPGTSEPASPSPARIELVDVTEATGIDHVAHFGRPEQKDWVVTSYGGGVACLDLEGDGDQDLFFVDGEPLTSEGFLVRDPEARCRLYRNDGGLRFTEVAVEVGADLRGYGGGVASADYDGDGDDDLFVAYWGHNRLLRNRGDGTFDEVAAEAGVLGGEDDDSTGCAWGDVNGDGHLDLFVVNYVDQTAHILHKQRIGKAGRTCLWRDLSVFCGPIGLPAQRDRLYLGRGDGTFEDVTETALPGQIPRYGFQAVMFDAEGDGDLDVYVANDTHANSLWVNDGTGVFEDHGVLAGVAMDRQGEAQAGMGVAVGDVNQDGLPDVFVTNFSNENNALYLNRTRPGAPPSFRDVSHTQGVAQASHDRLAWGAVLADLDGDTDLDSVAACGHVFPEVDAFRDRIATTYLQPNQLLRNEGPPRFALTAVEDADGPLAIPGDWRGLIEVDLDDDGDQDLVVTRLNGRPQVLENRGGNAAGFLRVAVTDRTGRDAPAGTRVTVELPGDRRLVRHVHHGSSFLGDGDPRLHFGLGGVVAPVAVEVRWPDGELWRAESVEPNRLVRVVQGRDEALDDTRPDAGGTPAETQR